MQAQKSRFFWCIIMQLIWHLLREVLVTSHKHDRQINQIIRSKKTQKHKKELPLTFFNLLLVSWSLWKKTEVWGEKILIKEQDPHVRFPCWHWKSWKVRVQSRLLPGRHSAARNTKAERKNKHISGGKKVIASNYGACSYNSRQLEKTL